MITIFLYYAVGNSTSMVTVDSNEVPLNSEMDETHENGGIIDSNITDEMSGNGNDATDMDGHDTNGNTTEF